jgi:hypothetical protein
MALHEEPPAATSITTHLDRRIQAKIRNNILVQAIALRETYKHELLTSRDRRSNEPAMKDVLGLALEPLIRNAGDLRSIVAGLAISARSLPALRRSGSFAIRTSCGPRGTANATAFSSRANRASNEPTTHSICETFFTKILTSANASIFFQWLSSQVWRITYPPAP